MSRRHILIGVALVVCFAAGLAVDWLLPIRQQLVAPAAPSRSSPATSPSPWIVYLPKESITQVTSTRQRILNVEHWAFRYTGGPIDCWLDVEETGQPDKEMVFTGKGAMRPLASEGTIHFAIRHPLSQPDRLPEVAAPRVVAAKEGAIGFGVGDESIGAIGPIDGWWFGWGKPPNTGAMLPEPEKGQLLMEGKDVTLLIYEANERALNDPPGPDRKVKLTLKARLSTKEP
jgi:hypothetical protein